MYKFNLSVCIEQLAVRKNVPKCRIRRELLACLPQNHLQSIHNFEKIKAHERNDLTSTTFEIIKDFFEKENITFQRNVENMEVLGIN